MELCFHQNGNSFQNFVPKQLLITWGFPALYFGWLSDVTKTCQAVTLKRQ